MEVKVYNGISRKSIVYVGKVNIYDSNDFVTKINSTCV